MRIEASEALGFASSPVTVSARLTRTDVGERTEFEFAQRCRWYDLLAIPLSILMAGMLVWDYATGLPRALPTFEWQHITLAALFFLFTMYLYRWLLLSFLWGKFGARVIEVGDRVVMSNKLFNVKVKYKSFRMAKVVSAEVCHRDDGKTDGTAETPEPGQYFVRLRFPSTTFMITDWIEKSEAAAIAEGINQRLPDGRTI